MLRDLPAGISKAPFYNGSYLLSKGPLWSVSAKKLLSSFGQFLFVSSHTAASFFLRTTLDGIIRGRYGAKYVTCSSSSNSCQSKSSRTVLAKCVSDPSHRSPSKIESVCCLAHHAMMIQQPAVQLCLFLKTSRICVASERKVWKDILY